MRARIYQPSRNAMQSGMARTKHWVLAYGPSTSREIDPLMGWTGSTDTQSQVRLRFDTREDAEAYAREMGLELDITEPQTRAPIVRPRGYGENFATDRKGAWTH